MVSVIAEAQIADYGQFITVFTTAGKQIRQRHGCRRSVLFRDEDPHLVHIVFDWESEDQFRQYLKDPEVKAVMKSCGLTEPPKFTFVHRVCEMAG